MAKRAAAPTPTRKRAPRKTNGANGASPAPVTAQAPNEDDIRVRAYHRYLERGAASGGDFDDWLEAERDLKGHAS